MSDISDTIKGFYSDFILRDLLSFVTPGAIVVFSLVFALWESWEKIIYTLCLIPWPVWILIFGFFYLTGLTLQIIGESICCFKFPPKKYQNIYRDINKKINEDDNGNSIPVDKEKQYTKDFDFKEEFQNSKYYAEFRLPFIKKQKIIRQKEKYTNVL